FPSAEPRADRWEEDAMNFGPGRIVKGWEMTAAGYTAVWATGNTRAELWDAMMRRETYATSGPHMTVRFFGGYDFTQADASRTPAVAGYTRGVPMGGDLPAAPAGKAPTFLVAALKDRLSGNLDRIQIIKGWLGKDGTPQEKIYDVVWGDRDRRKIVNGKLTPVGNTVDVATATWTNTIGDPELVAVWRDPDFDPSVRAVYYARVLEIPTPRWTAYDAAYLLANQARFVQPAILTFEQVFIGASTSGPGVVRAVTVTDEALRTCAKPEALGKPTLLAYRMTRTPADLVARDFGASFAEALE